MVCPYNRILCSLDKEWDISTGLIWSKLQGMLSEKRKVQVQSSVYLMLMLVYMFVPLCVHNIILEKYYGALAIMVASRDRNQTSRFRGRKKTSFLSYEFHTTKITEICFQRKISKQTKRRFTDVTEREDSLSVSSSNRTVKETALDG